MKAPITSEFLRGILFAFVAYRCYIYASGLWIGFFPKYVAQQAATAALFLGVYGFLFIGLLFRPDRIAKTAFVFLTLFCLLSVGSVVYWLNYPLKDLPYSPFDARFVASLVMSIAVAIVAYFHLDSRRQLRRA